MNQLVVTYYSDLDKFRGAVRLFSIGSTIVFVRLRSIADISRSSLFRFARVTKILFTEASLVRGCFGNFLNYASLQGCFPPKPSLLIPCEFVNILFVDRSSIISWCNLF